MDPESSSDVTKLISSIRHGKVLSSMDKAIKTEDLLEKLISSGKWKSAQDLMKLIKLRIGLIFQELPNEVISKNIMKQVLKIIREEYEAISKRKGEDQTLHHLISANPTDVIDYSEEHSSLRLSLLDHLSEYRVELEASTENIAAQSCEHIHSNEVILTTGRSHTAEKFLKYAAKKRQLQVFVIEGAPSYSGRIMAENLAKHNIPTVVLPDSHIFAIMPKVNHVIIGTHSILANGALRVACGVRNITRAAKYFSVPVLVLTHMYQLTREFADNQTFDVLGNPSDVLPASIESTLDNVDIVNPLYDYVPQEEVTLFISSMGGYSPSYVYRLMSELYHPDDHDV